MQIWLEHTMNMGTHAVAIEPFVKAARSDNMLGFFLCPMPGDSHQACRAELHVGLKLYTSRSSAALKMVELPPMAANPARVRRWLESSPPHISLVFSPLKERGPPRR